MTQIVLDISMSLDGFVAGPHSTLADPLGENGLLLHEWVFGLASWRARHGLEGGETGADDELVARGVAAVSATVMGRRMFSGGASVAAQCLREGLLDRLDLHVAPVLLGSGTQLFEGADLTRLEAPVAHLTYRPAAP